MLQDLSVGTQPFETLTFDHFFVVKIDIAYRELLHGFKMLIDSEYG